MRAFQRANRLQGSDSFILYIVCPDEPGCTCARSRPAARVIKPDAHRLPGSFFVLNLTNLIDKPALVRYNECGNLLIIDSYI